jgi:hypothetical protein
MQVRQIAEGLWTWTALADVGTADWQEVGCVYYEAPGAVVLIDPLVPIEDPVRFHEALDRDVGRCGRPVRILLTAESHRRSSEELAERYGGAIGALPAGVEIACSAWDELVYWIPEHRTLVFGDVVLGRAGGLRPAQARIGEERWPAVVEELRPLLELPAERALVAHGEPVLGGARTALAAALAD